MIHFSSSWETIVWGWGAPCGCGVRRAQVEAAWLRAWADRSQAGRQRRWQPQRQERQPVLAGSSGRVARSGLFAGFVRHCPFQPPLLCSGLTALAPSPGGSVRRVPAGNQMAPSRWWLKERLIEALAKCGHSLGEPRDLWLHQQGSRGHHS